METSAMRTWLEHLSEGECWQLLSLSPVGRLAVLVDSAPEVYPVNHVVDGRTIVFRTDPGNKLRGLDRSPSVAFEVDGLNLADRTGWSVLVKARAHEITEPAELAHVNALPLDYWGIGPKAHFVRLVPTMVSGRRLAHAP